MASDCRELNGDPTSYFIEARGIHSPGAAFSPGAEAWLFMPAASIRGNVAMKSVTVGLLAVVTCAAPALAETRTERAACTPDVMRLCASQIPNVGAITSCLQEKRASLSSSCRMVMDGSGDKVRTVATRR
jgi:ribosomal protein S19E (S16A)